MPGAGRDPWLPEARRPRPRSAAGPVGSGVRFLAWLAAAAEVAGAAWLALLDGFGASPRRERSR